MKQQEKAGENRSMAEVFTASLGAASVAEMDPSWSPSEVDGPESLVAMLLPWPSSHASAKEPAKEPAEGPADGSADGTADGASDEASDPVAAISDLLLATDRLLSWVTARQTELVADLHREVQNLAASHAASQAASQARAGSRQGIGTGLGFTLTAEELAPLLNLSGRAAHRLLGHSLTLALDLPKTLQCLGMGVIAVRQAQIIADEEPVKLFV